jgi:hypothetical protein
MLRKLTMLMFTMLLTVALSACNGDDNESADDANNDEKTAQEDGGGNSSNDGNKKSENQVDAEKTVATVNGEEIKGSDYNSMIQRLQLTAQQTGQQIDGEQMKQQAIDTLVRTELLLQDAEEKGYKPSEKQVQEKVDQFKDQYENKEQLNQVLEQNNLTEDQLPDMMSEQLQLDMYTKEEVESTEPTDKEIKKFYEQYSKSTENAQKLEEIKPAIKQRLKDQKISTELTKITDELKEDSEVEVLI